MDEMQNQEAPKMSSVENDQEEFELNHTDKLVGVFSEPTATFAKTAKFPPKTSDWIIPILVVIVIAILSQVVMMNNPAIRQSIMEKQMERFEKQFQDAVDKGQMTQEQANEQLDTLRDRMSQSGTLQLISTVVGIPIVVFIIFFIISGFFLLVVKVGLKGDGVYKDAMVAYGLPHYIIAIQQIVMVIAALATSKVFTGTSVADFIGSDKTTMAGFFLGKLDVFSIWFYVVFGIGLSKMFKSSDVKKYVIAVIGVWIVFSLIFFYIAKAVPFLAGFAG